MNDRIIVTGALGALGSAVVTLLRERGLAAVGVDLSDDVPTDETYFGGIDLTDASAVDACFARIAEGGAIKGLVNIAGGFCWETVADGSSASWERMFMMNTLTAVNSCRAALSLLPRGGSIVNIGAAATAKAAAGMGAYTASKSGVARLTEALADEAKSAGIRVNAVLPSIIDTAANRKDMGDADADSWVTVNELAEVIAFLLSDAASGVTGASVPVTGRV